MKEVTSTHDKELLLAFHGDLIQRLGGVESVAEICKITRVAVSKWKRKDGIPRSRMMYFEAVYPKHVAESQKKVLGKIQIHTPLHMEESLAIEPLKDWIHINPHDPTWRTIAKVAHTSIALVQAVWLQLSNSALESPLKDTWTIAPETVAAALDEEESAVNAILQAMQNRVINGKKIIDRQFK